MTLLIRNLSQIATPLGRGALRGRAMRELAVNDNAVIIIRDGRFAFVGRESDIDAELNHFRPIGEANENRPGRLIPTCRAAHFFPPEGRTSAAGRRGYVSTIIGEILPAVAEEKLAIFCDVFVERGVFTNEEGDAVLRAGAALGFIPRMHADELSDTDGASLAASLGCASADHLMQISDAGIAALASSN